MVNEAFETLMDSLDEHYHQACQDIDASRNALDAKYTQTRQGLVDAGGLIQKLTGNPSTTSPAPTKATGKTRPRKEAAPSASAGQPAPCPSLPPAAAKPKRSTRRAVFDAIADWNTSEGIATATGYTGKQIRGVLAAADLRAKIERRPGGDGRQQYRLVPTVPAA